MKRPISIIVRSIFLCTTVVFVAGCAVGGARIYDEEHGDVVTEVTPSRSKVHPGDGFDVVVTVHNNSGSGLEFGFPVQQQFGIQIVHEEEIVAWWPYMNVTRAQSLGHPCG